MNEDEKCYNCGKSTTYCGIDPYMSEIYDNYDEFWICDECYKESLMAI